MEKIIIYSNGTKILIVGNAINTDLLCEYIHIVYEIPYPKINFSYGIENAENKIIAMTLYKNRIHFCKRFLIHSLARREHRKICTFDFNNAMVALDEIIKNSLSDRLFFFIAIMYFLYNFVMRLKNAP